jgi:RimJ/RimL family protein N-acetyltransferase
VTAHEPEVHLRMLHGGDAGWMAAMDRTGYGDLPSYGWVEGKLAAELDEGVWATEDQVGWAVLVDGEPAGVAFAQSLTSGDGVLDIRLAECARGRGVGREVLRQLADHHFAENPGLRRVEGRTHEDNVPMQRAFNAAGFKMEARYREAIELADGTYGKAWGYALTRTDWEAGDHRADDAGYDLHGLVFELTQGGEPAQLGPGAVARFLQERNRVLVRYEGGKVTDGEAAGILLDDSFRYRFVHIWEHRDRVTGWGHARVQRRGDDRLEIIDTFERDDGERSASHVWVERR